MTTPDIEKTLMMEIYRQAKVRGWDAPGIDYVMGEAFKSLRKAVREERDGEWAVRVETLTEAAADIARKEGIKKGRAERDGEIRGALDEEQARLDALFTGMSVSPATLPPEIVRAFAGLRSLLSKKPDSSNNKEV